MIKIAYDPSALPYTLSATLIGALDATESENYEKAKNRWLDFMEISTMYLSQILLALLREQSRKDASPHTGLERVVASIDAKRPMSFGHWLNEIFVPLSKVACETMPQHPLVKAIGESLFTGKKRVCLLLGDKHTPSVVFIRNHNAHGTARSEEKNRETIQLLQPHVEAMVSAMSPLCHASETNVDAHYVIQLNADAETPLDLYPLMLYSDKGVPYMFHTLLENESVQHITADANADIMVSDQLAPQLDIYMQAIWPQFSVARDKNWEGIRAALAAESARYLSRVYKEKKYNQELFVERQALTQSLHNFWQSPASLFPLIGDAGQGKTNQLCYWTEQLIKDGKAVLIFNGADFSSLPLDLKLKDLMGANPKKDVMKLIRSMHEKACQQDEYIYIFFDAINECLNYAESRHSITNPPVGETLSETQLDNSGSLHLYNALRQLFIDEGMPRFKVLFTCRTYTWKQIILPSVKKDDQLIYQPTNNEETTISGFTDEETRQAYHIYRKLYQMHTEFGDIARSVCIRLKDPLILKYVCTNYLGRQLTTDVANYTSIALFEKMMADIANSYAGQLQIEILKLLAQYFLESYLRNLPIDGISIAHLRQAEPGSLLHRLSSLILKDDGISIAYAELLNKAERPVLREVEKQTPDGHTETHIQFVYERFLEYLMGRCFAQFFKAEAMQVDVAHPAEQAHPLSASTYTQVFETSAVNAVFMGAMRDAIIIDFLRTGQTSTIIDLAATTDHNFNLTTLVSQTIDTLIRENYEVQLFDLMGHMLSFLPDGAETLIQQFNEVNQAIASNKATPEIIATHKELSGQLASLIQLRNVASVAVINGILLSDFFNENLYRQSPLELLWQLMTDSLLPVRNTACMYAYYLSNHTHTTGHTQLRQNLTEHIVAQMYANLKKHSLPAIAMKRSLRERAPIFFETATRLCVLLIIDAQLEGGHDSSQQTNKLLNEIRSVVSHFTWRYRLIRLVMPFVQIAMRRQITFQSDYVNNAIEYQGFWHTDIVPAIETDGKWSRQTMVKAMDFINFYATWGEGNLEDPRRMQAEHNFANLHPAILDAYHSGDSLSYFVLERVLAVMGAARWENIQPVVTQFFSDDMRRTPWFDYSQMSMLYVLLQTQLHSSHHNAELLSIYEREARDWTLRLRGLFKARFSQKANPQGLYKRNVLTWYAACYLHLAEDNQPLPGDERAAPLFYELIDQATSQTDKELLYHIIENVSELIADFGYIQTGLSIMKYIIGRLPDQDIVDKFDAIDCSQRGGIYTNAIVPLVGSVLSTAKNYHPTAVDRFVRSDIQGMPFPGVSAYREEILTYHPSGETLSDLFTHKFGKFLIWSLMNEPAVDRFATDAIAQTAKASDLPSWFSKAVKVLMLHLFGIKL